MLSDGMTISTNEQIINQSCKLAVGESNLQKVRFFY